MMFIHHCWLTKLIHQFWRQRYETAFSFQLLECQIINYMPKTDQIVEEKTLTFKTLSMFDSEEVSRFVMANLRASSQMGEEERFRLHSIVNSIMIPALQSEWSFVKVSLFRAFAVTINFMVFTFLSTFTTSAKYQV